MKIKRNTIKWRIFKYNLIVIVVLIALSTIVSNIAMRFYMENETRKQLALIASGAEATALRRGPDFFPQQERLQPPREMKEIGRNQRSENEFLRFYFELDRSLREPLSVLNADYILLDSKKNAINFLPDEFKTSEELNEKIINAAGKTEDLSDTTYLNLKLSGTDYIVIVKDVSHKNSFDLSRIIIYSSLEKINQLQTGINVILFIILALSSMIAALISSLAAKKISAPFSALNDHIGAIAERNFGAKILLSVDDEMQDLVSNINVMSDKLESYDKAQKTFLQNASHEFRTPLMSIQSYAEGIKYGVVENTEAAEIIIDETKRMTRMVEDLLYLSRLDTIEEDYRLEPVNLNDILQTCVERMKGIASKENIEITAQLPEETANIHADEEMLTRAITNIIGNCIRYARTAVKITCAINPEDNKIEIAISDDGPGFDCEELPVVFQRFYKGKKGNSGLGLAISKAVVEKHGGSISAGNTGKGALFIFVLPIKPQSMSPEH